MESVENASSPDKGFWGISHVATGVVLSIVSSVFVGSLVLTFVDSDPLPLWITALLQVPLWFGLLGVPWLILKRERLSWRDDLGIPLLIRKWKTNELTSHKKIDHITVRQCIEGLLIGVFSQAILVPLLYLPALFFVDDLDVSGPARELTERAHGIGIFLLVLVVVVGAPVVEEIFFRGFALRAFQDRWPPTPVLHQNLIVNLPVGEKGQSGLIRYFRKLVRCLLWKIRQQLPLIASSLLFGLVHFQPLQFPALVLFGLIAGKIAQRDGHLGRAICAHAGFNAYTVFVLVYL